MLAVHQAYRIQQCISTYHKVHCLHSAVPPKVSGVRFVPSPDENSLAVKWSRPQSNFSILYYEIQYRSHTARSFWQGPVKAKTESVTLRISLTSSAPYGVQVRAVSEIGAGPYSSEETVKRLFPHTHITHTHAHMHTYTCTIHQSIPLLLSSESNTRVSRCRALNFRLVPCCCWSGLINRSAGGCEAPSGWTSGV